LGISILVVDDHPMFRFGLLSLLSQEKDFNIVGEASNSVEALGMLKKLRPDILLLDISMPGLDGLNALPRIAASSPDTKVIMLTAFDNDDFLSDAIMSGAYGYLLKSQSPGKIVQTIREVNDGFRMLDKEQINCFIKSVQAASAGNTCEKYDLSPREVELLRRLSEGESYEEMSESMFLSIPTVKRSVGAIVSKMMVKNRVQAVSEAVKLGLI